MTETIHMLKVEFPAKAINKAIRKLGLYILGIQRANKNLTGDIFVTLNSANFFKKELEELELQISNAYSKLLRLKVVHEPDLFRFLTEESQIANWREHTEDMIQVSWYNDITGTTLPFAIQTINEDGIFGMIEDLEYDNDAYRQIQFHELASIEDRITVINRMEEMVEKQFS